MWLSQITKSSILLLLTSVILSHSAANILQESLIPHQPLNNSRIKRDAFLETSTLSNGENDGREEISGSPEGLDGVKTTIAPSRVSVKPTMTVTATRIGMTRYFTPPLRSSSPASPQLNTTPHQTPPHEQSLYKNEKDLTSSPTPLFPDPGEEENDVEDQGNVDKSALEEETPGRMKDNKDSWNSVQEETEEDAEAAEGDRDAEVEEGTETEEQVDEEAELLSVLGGSRRNFDPTWKNFSDVRVSREELQENNSTTTTTPSSTEHNHPQKPDSKRFPLNMQGGRGVDDNPEHRHPDKNASNISDSITFSKNEILETLPQPALLVGSTANALFPNETTATLEEDFAQAFNNNGGGDGTQRRRRLRGPVRRRVRKMRIPKPDNATSPTGISSDTFFYPPNEYFTPNLNADRPNSFNQGQYLTRSNPVTKPDTRIRMVRRFRSTTTALPPTNPNDFPQTTTESPNGGNQLRATHPTFTRFNDGGVGGGPKKPVILLRSPTIPTRQDNDEEFDLSEDESEPQIERPNSYPYTEKSNTFTDHLTNTITPDLDQGVKKGGPEGSSPPSQTPRVHNNETGEWLQSEHSKHHDISHDNEPTLHPYGEDRDQWEQNYMNLQQNSFFSPSAEQPDEETPIITAEDVLAKHHHGQGEEGQHHESFERTLTKSVSMSDGPDPAQIVQSYNTREPTLTVVEHHHHLPTLTINHPPTYDEGSQILHDSFNDALSSPPLPPPPTPPKYLPQPSSLYGEDKIPSGSSYPSQQLQQSSGGNNYFSENPSPYSSALSPSPFKPYLSSPDSFSQSEGSEGAKKKTRGGGSHYDRTRHRYSQHPPPNELFQDNKGAYPDTSNYSNTRLHSNPSNTSPTFTSTDAKENLAPPPNPAHSPPTGPSMFSSHEFPNHPQGSKTIPGPPPPGFRNPYMPKIEDHFSAMRNSIFKETNSFPHIPPPQSYSHFSKGPAAVDHHDPSINPPTKSSSFQNHHHHPPPTGDGQLQANSPSSSSFIPGITASSPFNSLSTYINEHPPQPQSKKRPAPVWPGKQPFSTNPSGPSRSPKKIPQGSYSHVNPMDSPSNSFRTSSHYGGSGGGPPDFSPYHPSFYDASSPNSPKLTLPMPGLVSIPTPPPDSHAMNQVTPNRHFPPHTHSMSSSSDYEPANPPLPAGHALSQHFDHFVQNAGEFKDDDHHHPHHDHHEEEGEYTEPEIITKNKSKPRGEAKYKNRGASSSTFTGKFPESKKNRNKYGNKRKPSKSKDNGAGSESERSPAGYYSSSSSSSSPSRGKNQYKDLSLSQQSQPDITTIITSPDYANDASSSAMIEFDSPPSYEPTSPYSLPYSDQDYPDQYKQYKYKGRPKDYEDEDLANNQPKYPSKRPRKNNYQQQQQEYHLPSYVPSYQEEGNDNSIRDAENYNSHDHSEGEYNKYEKESTPQDPPPKNPQSSSTKDNDSPQEHKPPPSSTTPTTETEANLELEGSGPSPFSETPYVLMFPNTLQIRHPSRPSPLHPSPPALSVLNAEIPMGSASEHLSPNPEKFLGPGLKAVPVHPRHQMMKVLATKQYLTHLEAVQERQRKPPPAIYTPYGVLVPMGLSSPGTQAFVPPPKLQANAYSQLSPSYSAHLPPKQSLDEKSLLSVLLGHKSHPKLPFDSSSFKSDKTMDLKESIDPALDLLAEKLAIKLSSLEPFTPFRQSTSSAYPLLYMQGTSYSELKPVKTPYKNSTTLNKSKSSSSAPPLRTNSPSSSSYQTTSYFNKHPGNPGSGNLLSPQPEYQQQTLKQLSPASSSSYSAQSQFPGEASPVLKSILKERLYEMLQESYAEAASSYSQSIAPTQGPTQSFMKKLEVSQDSQKSFIPDNPFSSPKKSSRQQQGSSSSKLLSSLLNFAGQPSTSGANKYQSHHHQNQQQQQQLQKKQHRPLYQPTGILSAIKRLFSYHPSPNNRQDSLNGASVRKNSNISHPLLPPHPFASHPPTKRIKIPADSPWSGRRPSKKFTHPPPTSTTPSSKSTTTREGSDPTKTEWKASNSMQNQRDNQPTDGIDPQAHGFKSVADMEKMLRYLLKLKPQLETEERKYSAEHHQHNPLLSSHSPTTLETLIHGKQRLANPPTLLNFLPSHPFSQETSASSLVSKRSSSPFSTINDLSASSSSTHSVAILPTSSSATTFLPLNMSSNKHLAQSKTSPHNLSHLTLPYQNHFFPIPTSWKPIPDSVSLPSSNPPTKPQDPNHHSSSNSLAPSVEKQQTQKAP